MVSFACLPFQKSGDRIGKGDRAEFNQTVGFTCSKATIFQWFCFVTFRSFCYLGRATNLTAASVALYVNVSVDNQMGIDEQSGRHFE